METVGPIRTEQGPPGEVGGTCLHPKQLDEVRRVPAAEELPGVGREDLVDADRSGGSGGEGGEAGRTHGFRGVTPRGRIRGVQIESGPFQGATGTGSSDRPALIGAVSDGIHDSTVCIAEGQGFASVVQGAAEITSDRDAGVADGKVGGVVIGREDPDGIGREGGVCGEPEFDSVEGEPGNRDRSSGGVAQFDEFEGRAAGGLVLDLRDADGDPRFADGEGGLGHGGPGGALE